MVPIPERITPFWAEFTAATGVDQSARFQEAFHFDDSQPSADALAQLVLRGAKRATAGLAWSFEAEGQPFPQVGALNVITDWVGDPVCVVETVQVDIVPYKDVGAEFAAVEGEGDGSLEYWQHVHAAYFARECVRIGREPSDTMPIVCERFRVIYPNNPPTLYTWLGGIQALQRLTARFYERVPSNPTLAPVFAHMNADHAKHVAAFLAEVLGGPEAYSASHGGHPHMIRQHLNRHLSQEQRRAWVALLLDTADELGMPDDPEFRSALVGYLEWGSRLAVLNSQEGATVNADAPMPKWGWGEVEGPYVP